MFYNVKALSLEELEMLYIKESQKLATALEINIPHNNVMIIKKHLDEINGELNRLSKSDRRTHISPY